MSQFPSRQSVPPRTLAPASSVHRSSFRLHRSLRSPPAFTLVELLTVIGIIVILISFLFVAVKHVRNSAARSRTLVQLQTLNGMLGELDNANHFSQSPQQWLWYGLTPVTVNYLISSNSTVAINAGVIANSDFWRYPFGQPYTPPYIDSLDAPGDVNADVGTQQDTQRNASFAVLNTQLAMQLLAADPANRAALDKLSADSKMLPAWTGNAPLQATIFIPAKPDYTGLLKEDGSDALVSPTPNYLPGMHVSSGGHFYVGVPTATPVTPITATPPGTGWSDETAAPRGAPLLLDGWGNPIIFVPASGLHVKLLNGQSSYLPADPSTGQTQEFVIVSPEGHVTGNGTTNPYADRVGRPFFASAGPDGDFTKGDDNLYSFSQ